MWNIAFVSCSMLCQLMDQKNKYQAIMQVSEYKPVAVMNVFSGICRLFNMGSRFDRFVVYNSSS